ncbi:acyltransferase family protein [Streptomyces sp. NA04227]|uniref:lysophospholipid acyltransferase family protein n=1 Tax=Streptomyces sp. NA04227 TaxID=2742136 RepID=UPI0015927E57|nr:lysophospholipid acyltransferase family protein [Streptomyces sp. NA04227]QKW08343.1 acyltransferase family protein [Streptomyces sp. NA04227]
MADAKVIPFDDDRSRAGERRTPRRAPAANGNRDGHPAEPVPINKAAANSASTKGTSGKGGSGGRSGAKGRRGRALPEQPSAPHDERMEQRGGAAREADGASGDSRGEGGGDKWERRIAGGLKFLRRRLTGDYEVDDFGYDAELTEQVLMSVLRPAYEKYFRVEVKGIENIPSEGGALIVANHSGTLPLDGLMLQVAVHDEHPDQRNLRLLAADLVFALPVVSEIARKAGHTLACAEDAERLLARGELVGVMPEGFKGIGKPFGERYKLQRFGRGGFVSTALRARTPIVPCSIVGAEEIYPMIGNAKTLARVLGFPYFPITPTFPLLGPLGAVPLPTKWTIQFGEPIPTDGYPPEAAEDPMLMFNLTDQVREQIQHTLYKLLVQRRSVFF